MSVLFIDPITGQITSRDPRVMAEPPVFRTTTEELDWWRWAFLGAGVVLGALLFAKGRQ